MVVFFARMIQLRIKADYNSLAEVSEAEVLEMAPLSHEFVAAVEGPMAWAFTRLSNIGVWRCLENVSEVIAHVFFLCQFECNI